MQKILLVNEWNESRLVMVHEVPFAGDLIKEVQSPWPIAKHVLTYPEIANGEFADTDLDAVITV